MMQPAQTGAAAPQSISIQQVISEAYKHRAKGVYILGGSPIQFRIGQNLIEHKNMVMPPEAVEEFVGKAIQSDAAASAQFSRLGWATIMDSTRDTAFTMTIMREANGTRIAIHLGAHEAAEFSKLGLPAIIETFVQPKTGLVIIAGPGESGKTTAAEGLVSSILARGGRSVYIIGKRREFIHTPVPGTHVAQIEAGHNKHISTIASAIQAASTCRADVILVNDFGMPEDAQQALTAVERGALVIVLIDARNVAQAIERIASMGEVRERQLVLTQIANNLVGGVALRLLPSKANPQRSVPVAEVLVVDDAVRRAIRSDETHTLNRSIMTQGRESGMLTLEMALSDAVRANHISAQHARENAVYPDLIANG